ncbi:MAG: hypothetical protein IPO88_30565 [Nannocystis sp.]|uniref:hypothetical protein n=1 Tax=Nannocystis sp. TaxID=1962667 RepID=UPI00242571F9|nr:hypothetical protein [Nannocystis sp.]MBK9757777.1 hypothetical protein [Nannocystis sp.]
MNTKQLVSHVASLCALIAVAACNNDTPTGNLEVSFQIGSGVPCDTLGVEDITVKLVSGSDLTAEPTAEVTVACDEGKALLTSVEVGTYHVVVEGTDSSNTVVVDNGLTAMDPNNQAEVLEGQDTKLNNVIKLSPTPAKLLVRWNYSSFKNQCDQIPVANYEVIGYKNGGTAQIAMGSFACDSVADAGADGTYHSFPDPNRVVDGAELDSIEITPRDATGNVVGTDIVYSLMEPPGPGKTVELTFSVDCTDTTCDLACKSDPCLPD